MAVFITYRRIFHRWISSLCYLPHQHPVVSHLLWPGASMRRNLACTYSELMTINVIISCSVSIVTSYLYISAYWLQVYREGMRALLEAPGSYCAYACMLIIWMCSSCSWCLWGQRWYIILTNIFIMIIIITTIIIIITMIFPRHVHHLLSHQAIHLSNEYIRGATQTHWGAAGRDVLGWWW